MWYLSSLIPIEQTKNNLAHSSVSKSLRSTLSLPESITETRNVVITVQSVDKIILWCTNSNETSFAVLSHGAICFFF